MRLNNNHGVLQRINIFTTPYSSALLRGFLIILTFLFLSCPSAPEKKAVGGIDFDYVPNVPDTESAYPAEAMGNKTALRYFRDEKIALGWNVGNTLDAYSNGKSGETLWGNPEINQDLMNGLKAAGFDIVRIPITWMGRIGAAPDYHIEDAWMRRVGEVAGLAHKAGLKVIINLHHDGSTSGKTKEDGWLSLTRARESTENYNQITQKFIRVWKQIAVYFKNYGEWLMFESFNELHDGGWGEGNQSELNPQIDILNEWNQYFTNIVRKSGGNNETRYLVIPGYCTKAKHTLSSAFVLPRDTVPDKQVVTFHYYDPYQFGIQGKMSKWGSAEDKQSTDAVFAPFKEKFVDKGIPVIIAEMGAVRQVYPGDSARDTEARQSRLAYLSHVCSTAKKYGLVPIYWDNGATTGGGEKFGLFSRADGQPNSDVSKTMIEAMVNAAK
ncbi:MAG: glycoside hydrolase family 5 protein [Spirochaetaceae bacterium]|jgi:endoglucanase|nr:glycoside hydrolase family 5 protein [Spirochaetaceae bacterium]